MSSFALVLVLAAEAASALSALEPAAGGLTLSAAYDQAVTRSPAVNKATSAFDTAAADADVAYSLFFPRLDLSAGYTRLSEVELPPFEIDVGLGEPIVADNPFPQILDNWDTRATLSIPATDYFLVTLHLYDATLRAATVQRFELEARREVTALRAGEALLGLVRARAYEDIARESVSTLGEALSDMRRLADAGFATETDALRVQAQRAGAEVALQRARGAARVAHSALRTLLGAAPDAELVSGEDLRVVPGALAPTPDLERLLESALSQRPEILALGQLVALQQSNLSLQEGRLYPSVSLFGTANYTSPNQRIFPSTRELRGTWTAGVSVGWSPNDLVFGLTNRRHARRDLDAAEADLEAVRDAVTLEVTEAQATFGAAAAAVGSAHEGLEAAAAAYQGVRERLAAGDAGTSELLDAESQLRRAELQLAEACIDYHLARIRVAYVQGRLTASAGEGGSP